MLRISIKDSIPIYDFPLQMYRLKNNASSYDNEGDTFLNPYFRLYTPTVFTPSSFIIFNTSDILYCFLFILFTNYFNNLFESKFIFFLQSSSVTYPSLLKSRSLKSYWLSCSVISEEIFLQAYQTSSCPKTYLSEPDKQQKSLND